MALRMWQCDCNMQRATRIHNSINARVPLIAQAYFIHWSLLRNFFFCVCDFCGWSRSRNYFKSEIFPIYSSMSQGTWSDLPGSPPVFLGSNLGTRLYCTYNCLTGRMVSPCFQSVAALKIYSRWPFENKALQVNPSILAIALRNMQHQNSKLFEELHLIVH